jgi:hypothetical protein
MIQAVAVGGRKEERRGEDEVRCWRAGARFFAADGSLIGNPQTRPSRRPHYLSSVLGGGLAITRPTYYSSRSPRHPGRRPVTRCCSVPLARSLTAHVKARSEGYDSLFDTRSLLLSPIKVQSASRRSYTSKS